MSYTCTVTLFIWGSLNGFTAKLPLGGFHVIGPNFRYMCCSGQFMIFAQLCLHSTALQLWLGHPFFSNNFQLFPLLECSYLPMSKAFRVGCIDTIG